MYQDIDSRESKLRGAYEALENGNIKRALIETNKVLKKNPKAHTAIALKALIFARSSKVSDGYELMEKLMKDIPTEKGTLNVMLIFFKEINHEEKMLEYLNYASSKFPDKEDILTCLFFTHVRKCDFNSQQLVSRKLLQITPNSKNLRFWMALSTMMQGEKDPVLGKKLYLPLAEKILEKSLSEGLLTSHTDLQLFISVLKRLEKYELAIETLLRDDLIELLNTCDYKHDYTGEILSLFSATSNWPEILHVATDILDKDADDWSSWKTLLQHTFDVNADDTKPQDERLEKTEALIEKLKKQKPKSRGPLLAQMDFSANLVQRKLLHHPQSSEAFCAHLIRSFIDKFGGKPICALDIAYIIKLLLPDEKKRTELIESILKTISVQSLKSSPEDNDVVNRHVCAYRLARTNRVQFDLRDLLTAYNYHLPSVSRANIVDNKDEKEMDMRKDLTETTKDMLPPDGLLLLACSELMDPFEATSERHNLGRTVLAAHWLDSIGLQRSPENHFMRLRLASILGPGNGLCCADRQLKELEIMDLKQLLLVSLAHLSISPGPHLTIWGRSNPRPKPVIHQKAPKGKDAMDSDGGPSLSGFYSMLKEKNHQMTSEAEDWLVGAYRQQTFTQVREFSQFLFRLRHSDSLVSARTEFIYQRTLIKPNSFDEVLEKMPYTVREIPTVRKLLDEIVDCRDFSTVPEFTSQEQEPANQVETFIHLRLWDNLRLDMVELFAACAKLMMKLVVRLEAAGSPTSGSICGLGEEASVALKAMNDRAADLWARLESTKTANLEHFQYTDLLLTPETLFMNPPSLPSVSMVSFYFHGPYGETLKACLALVNKVCTMFEVSCDDKLKTFNQELDALFEGIMNPLAKIVGLQTGPCDGSTFPSPPSTDVFASNQNPSSILVGMGIAVETLVLALLFTSSIASMLRPRRFAHQPFAGKWTKRNKKSASDNQENGTQPPTTVLGAYFDRFAETLVDKMVGRLDEVSQRLGCIATEWAGWCSDRGARAFSTAAINAASATGLSDVLSAQWIPDPEDCPAICHDIACNLQTGFAELASICAKKLSSVSAMKSELHLFTELGKLTL